MSTESAAAARPAVPLDGARVLVVEDDPTVSDVVRRYLERAGASVETVADGVTGLARAQATRPDLVVLDLMLPGMHGRDVCRRLRASLDVPVVMLTALDQPEDRIAGLDIGADDYLPKPFSPRELVARCNAVLRRTQARGRDEDETEQPLRAGGLHVDVAARKAWRDGQEVGLTVREFELLVYLMRHPGKAFRREELLEAVWGYRFGDTSTVTVHVRRLREKIEPDPAEPTYVRTVWGVGYRFDGGDGDDAPEESV